MGSVKIVTAADHAGYALKEHLRQFLGQQGYTVVDAGTHSPESCDYPDWAAAGARELSEGRCSCGVFVCGTGLGMALAANKVAGVRAAKCDSEWEAELARRHNHANVVCLGGWTTGPRLAERIVLRFLQSEFEGGRHARRVDKIKALEKRLGAAAGRRGVHRTRKG
jgi:ribose 5-phosphate isomerase B